MRLYVLAAGQRRMIESWGVFFFLAMSRTLLQMLREERGTGGKQDGENEADAVARGVSKLRTSPFAVSPAGPAARYSWQHALLEAAPGHAQQLQGNQDRG